ncbi:621_t:CDS:2, partial [Racocetra persica]
IWGTNRSSRIVKLLPYVAPEILSDKNLGIIAKICIKMRSEFDPGTSG